MEQEVGWLGPKKSWDRKLAGLLRPASLVEQAQTRQFAEFFFNLPFFSSPAPLFYPTTSMQPQQVLVGNDFKQSAKCEFIKFKQDGN